MSRLGLLAAFLALFLVLGLAARWTATALQWSFTLTYLGFMLAVGALMSAFAWNQERRLARHLDQLPGEDRAALQALFIEARVASSGNTGRSAFLTVSVGVCVVSLPTLPLMVAPLFALQEWLSLEPPWPHFLALLVGFVLAWTWWSVAVSWWRRWAESRGMSPEEVQYRGQGASILWSPGHPFERTEWAHIRKRFF